MVGEKSQTVGLANITSSGLKAMMSNQKTGKRTIPAITKMRMLHSSRLTSNAKLFMLSGSAFKVDVEVFMALGAFKMG